MSDAEITDHYLPLADKQKLKGALRNDNLFSLGATKPRTLAGMASVEPATVQLPWSQAESAKPNENVACR